MSILGPIVAVVNLDYPAATTNPRDSWPSWTDADRWEPLEDEGYRPTVGPDFEPSEHDEAEWSGMSLRLAGEPMAEMIINSTGLLLRFAIGQMMGLEARLEYEAAERADAEERMADAFGVPEWNDDEMIRAVGCLASRLA